MPYLGGEMLGARTRVWMVDMVRVVQAGIC